MVSFIQKNSSILHDHDDSSPFVLQPRENKNEMNASIRFQSFDARAVVPEASAKKELSLVPITKRNNAGSGKNAEVILLTLLFGKNSTTNRPFRLFLETARLSGVDFAIIGDTEPPFELPINVKFLQMSWGNFVDRAVVRIQGASAKEEETKKVLRDADIHEKVIDFGPTLGYLFPELIQYYTWWGHIDTNMLLGNVTKFLTPELLAQHDLITIHPQLFAWAPMTFYRNVPFINDLFKKGNKSLDKVLLCKDKQDFVDRTMSGIVETISRQSVFRLASPTNQITKGGASTAFPILQGNAKQCKDMDSSKWCFGCIFDQGRLRQGFDMKEIVLCHFPGPDKKPQYTKSLGNDIHFQSLVQTRKFTLDWNGGFSSIGYATAPTEQEKRFYLHHFNNIQKIRSDNMLMWCLRREVCNDKLGPLLERFYYKKLTGRNVENDVKILLNSTDIDFFYAPRNLCHAAKAFHIYRQRSGARPMRHILLFKLGEDSGGFSSVIPNHTKPKEQRLPAAWENYGCTKEFIWEYLDHPDTLAAFTNQFQIYYHPKVYSIPLGFRDPGSKSRLHDFPQRYAATKEPWAFKKKLLMVNSKPWFARMVSINTTIDNFSKANMTLRNTYGAGRYLAELRSARFIMSPSGAGWGKFLHIIYHVTWIVPYSHLLAPQSADCYRNYEGIHMAAFPIIEHSNYTLDEHSNYTLNGWLRSYDNLPVAIIDSYKNLTPQWLMQRYQEMLDNFHNFNYEKMTKQWWVDFIYSHVNNTEASGDPADYWKQVSKPGGLAPGFEQAYLEKHQEQARILTRNYKHGRPIERL